MRTPVTFNRRSFLVGAGGFGLAIPFLPSLASAQATAPKRYFISWRLTNGYFGQHWYPSDPVLANLQTVEPNVRELPLSSISGPISPILDTEFDPFRSQMTLLRHLDHMSYFTDHNPATGLTGWYPGKNEPGLSFAEVNPGIDIATLPPSIDQLMARKIYGAVPVPPLNLSINYAASSGWSCSYTKAPDGKFQQQPGLYPRSAFNVLFSNFSNGDTTQTRRQAYRTSAIDLVKDHYQSVRNNPRLSTEDRASLNRYVDEIHQLGQRIKAMPTTQCTPPGQPMDWTPSEANVDAMAAAHVDIALAAIRCGLTRVVNLYLDPDTVMPNINSRGHHGLSHDSTPADIAGILTCHRWNMKYLKRLLTGLHGTVDPSNNQSYLHNALVMVTNEIGNQAGASGTAGVDGNHICVDGQYALFGSANGYLRPGYLVDYRTDHKRHRWSEYIGTAYNRLLITAMLAMGLTPSDWEVNGQPGYGCLRGSIYDLTPAGKVVVGDLRAPLPRLKA